MLPKSFPFTHLMSFNAFLICLSRTDRLHHFLPDLFCFLTTTPATTNQQKNLNIPPKNPQNKQKTPRLPKPTKPKQNPRLCALK